MKTLINFGGIGWTILFILSVLGFLFGLMCGSFWTWLLANIFVRAALPLLCAKFPETFSETLAKGAVMTFFLKINPVSLVLNFLTWIADKFTINK